MSIHFSTHLAPSPPHPVPDHSEVEPLEQKLRNLAAKILALPEEESTSNILFVSHKTTRATQIHQHTFQLLANHSSLPEIASILQHFLGKFSQEIFNPLAEVFRHIAMRYIQECSPTIKEPSCFFHSNCFIAQHFPFQEISAGGEQRTLELLNFFRSNPSSEVTSFTTLLRILTKRGKEESVAVATGLLLDYHHPSILSPEWRSGLPIVRKGFLRITQFSPKTEEFLQDPPLNLPKDLMHEIKKFSTTEEVAFRLAVNFCFSDQALEKSREMGRRCTLAHQLPREFPPADLVFGQLL